MIALNIGFITPQLVMKTMIGGVIFLIFGATLMGQAMSSAATIKLTSPDFSGGSVVPKKYTCDGPNVNPRLHFDGVPKETKSLALIVDDPDAPGRTWVHWLVWNIDPNTKEISENSSPRNAVHHTIAPTPASSRMMLAIDHSTVGAVGRLSIYGSCGQLFV